MLSFLAALQQADAAFPNGNFAFSNGVEGLAALGMPFDASSLAALLTAALRHRWAGCDRVVLVRAWRRGGDIAALASIDHAMEAATLPLKLRDGSRANGAALLAAHARLGSPGAAALLAAVSRGDLLGHLPVLQGVLWRDLGIIERDAVLVSAYTTASTLSTAALRLGRIGAIAAQRALRDALTSIDALTRQPVRDEGALVATTPWLDIACARQETAQVRMFSS